MVENTELMMPVCRRVQGEYLEMPGLRLTSAQAARLWATDRQTSERILETLTQAGFLSRKLGGAYVLASNG